MAGRVANFAFASDTPVVAWVARASARLGRPGLPSPVAVVGKFDVAVGIPAAGQETLLETGCLHSLKVVEHPIVSTVVVVKLYHYFVKCRNLRLPVVGFQHTTVYK